MQKIFIILLIIPTYIYAVYNPFFTELPVKKQEITEYQAPQPTPTKTYKPIQMTPRKSIEMTYFGFIESIKGEYALVAFNDKNIILQANDSLYDDEQVYKITKVTSNYILLKDNFGRVETVYFSSEEQKR